MFTTMAPMWGGGGGDPLFGSVVLLARFDGSLATVVGPTLASSGAVTMTETDAKFGQSLNVGGASPGGGGSNVVHTEAATTLLDLNSGDIAIEGWIKLNTTPSRPRTLIRIADEYDNDEYHIVADSGNWLFGYPTGASSNGSIFAAWAVGLWTHLALTRQGDTYRGFVNGVLVGTSTSVSYRRAIGNKSGYIGNSRLSFIDALDGLIDEVRITVGAARYTEDFPPPAAPFPAG